MQAQKGSPSTVPHPTTPALFFTSVFRSGVWDSMQQLNTVLALSQERTVPGLGWDGQQSSAEHLGAIHWWGSQVWVEEERGMVLESWWVAGKVVEVLEDQWQQGRKEASWALWQGGALLFCWDLGVLGVPEGCFCGPDKGQVMIRVTLEGRNPFMFYFVMRRLVILHSIQGTRTKKIEDTREGSRSFPPWNCVKRWWGGTQKNAVVDLGLPFHSLRC